MIVSDYLFDVRDRTILKHQEEYFIGGIQQLHTPVAVAVQSEASLLVYGVDDAEILITRHRFAIPHLWLMTHHSDYNNVENEVYCKTDFMLLKRHISPKCL